MPGDDPAVPSDTDIARLAGRQHGNVAYRQLTALGFSRDAIRHRVARERLVRRHRGVYAWGLPREDLLSRACAGQLAAGPRSVLSGPSAAAVYGALPAPAGPIHLTCPSRARDRDGIVIHEGDPGDVWRRRDLPLTSPVRTVFDLADMEGESTVTRVYNELQVLRLLTREQVLEALPGFNGRRGLSVVKRLVDGGLAPTRSVLEDLFVPLVRQAALPLPVLNARLLGMEVDALWPGERVIVELDGRRFHDTDSRFESDRARDARLVAAGHAVLRFTYRRLSREPFACVAELSAALTVRAAA